MTTAALFIGAFTALGLHGSMPEGRDVESASFAIGAVNSICLAIAAGQIPPPEASHTPRRRAFLAANGFSEIVPQQALGKLGQSRTAISDAAILGYRRIGLDDVFVAIGGSRIQSCRVAIGTSSLKTSNGQALNEVIAGTQIWDGDGVGADHGPIRLWRFTHRTASGQNARLSVVTGQRNLIRNLIVMIVESDSIDSSR